MGCAYAARCPLATRVCVDEDPALVAGPDGRRVACWHADAPSDAGVSDAGARLVPPGADPEGALRPAVAS